MFGKSKEEEIIVEKKKGTPITLGIDLGTLNTVICKAAGDKFDIYKIPSVVAVKKENESQVLAIGEDAKSMIGRTPEDIVAHRPLRKGVIENIMQAKALLEKSIEAGTKNNEIVERIVVGIPGDASEVEKNAITNILNEIGITNSIIISEGLAAAIGAGLPIAEADGIMIIDIGAGSTDIVVISLGGIRDIYTVRQGGDDIDAAIISQVKKDYNVEIGTHEAEEAKKQVGKIFSSATFEEKEIEIVGKSLTTKHPEVIRVKSETIAKAAEPIIANILFKVEEAVEKVGPDLISGVYKDTLAVGGTSQILGLKERIMDDLQLPVTISDDPMTVVAKGTAIVAAEPRALEPEVRLKAMR